MKVKLWTVVAAVLLAGGASANAQGLEGLSCSGELDVISTDEVLSVTCSGELTVAGDLQAPASPVRLAARSFDDGRAAGALSWSLPGADFGLVNPPTAPAGRDRTGGDLVLSGSGGIVLSGGQNPPTVLLVSSVPEPQTYALWLAGLAGVVAARRRTRR